MSKTINGITVASLTAVQAAIINQGRAHSSSEERKQIKREVFATVKAKFGIPQDVKVKANTSGGEHQKGYLILHVGGKTDDAGSAFVLGDDGKWNGTYATRDQLFPPAPSQAQQDAGSAQGAGSVFDQGVAAAQKWFRLDAAQVAAALTQNFDAISDFDGACASGMVNVQDPGVQQGGDLPTPHLMLAGRTDLAITADGSIYRKQ